jgi:hypothetical protein
MRQSWFDDDADLQVFVPGLMATGILVSIVMLIWDGIKRFIPDVGRRSRAARQAEMTSGRVNDLASIELGDVPLRERVQRSQRNRVKSLCLTVICGIASSGLAAGTFEVYNGTEGTLAHRGWTLSVGLGAAAVVAVLGLLWLLTAIVPQRAQPRWLQNAQTHWPIGDLPAATEADSSADA